jgi:hypothetical protein
MPDMGLSSANEVCDVKSLRGIQYLHDGQRAPKRKTMENGMGKQSDHEKPSRSEKAGRASKTATDILGKELMLLHN